MMRIKIWAKMIFLKQLRFKNKQYINATIDAQTKQNSVIMHPVVLKFGRSIDWSVG